MRTIGWGAVVAVICTLNPLGPRAEGAPPPCGVNLAAPQIQTAVDFVPLVPQGWQWARDPRSFEGNYNPCATLSTALITVQGATRSSPEQATHAFLWTARNALFYSTATDADFGGLEELGGVADQYLSHCDEARSDACMHRRSFRFVAARSRGRVTRDWPACPRRHSVGQPPRRRQRCRSHSDAGTFAGQHLLPRRRRRG